MKLKHVFSILSSAVLISIAGCGDGSGSSNGDLEGSWVSECQYGGAGGIAYGGGSTLERMEYNGNEYTRRIELYIGNGQCDNGGELAGTIEVQGTYQVYGGTGYYAQDSGTNNNSSTSNATTTSPYPYPSTTGYPNSGYPNSGYPNSGYPNPGYGYGGYSYNITYMPSSAEANGEGDRASEISRYFNCNIYFRDGDSVNAMGSFCAGYQIGYGYGEQDMATVSGDTLTLQGSSGYRYFRRD